MRWMIALMLLAGCGSPSTRREEIGPVEWTGPVHKTQVVQEQKGYTDPDGRLAIWKETVLARSDGDTLRRIQADTQERLRGDQARDAELASHHPGVVVENRLQLRNRIAFDKACLDLIDAALSK